MTNEKKEKSVEGFYFAMRNPNIEYGYRIPDGCQDRKPAQKEEGAKDGDPKD